MLHAAVNSQKTKSGEKLVFQLTQTDIDDAELMRYTTYGVRVLCEGKEDVPCMEFLDISTNKAFVERFIELCTTHEVSLVHVKDVLEDYLI